MESSLRADAQRNRDAVLAAAAQVFAEQGIDAPLNEIARRAGVGQGTLYRRFPTREALMQAIVWRYVEELGELAAEVGEREDGFLLLFDGAAHHKNEDRCFAELIARGFPNSEEVLRPPREAFYALLAEPLARAQAAGLVRSDLQLGDVRVLLQMTGAGLRGADPARALELAHAAMRP